MISIFLICLWSSHQTRIKNTSSGICNLWMRTQVLRKGKWLGRNRIIHNWFLREYANFGGWSRNLLFIRWTYSNWGYLDFSETISQVAYLSSCLSKDIFIFRILNMLEGFTRQLCVEMVCERSLIFNFHNHCWAVRWPCHK